MIQEFSWKRGKRKKKNSKTLLCGYNAKMSSRLIHFLMLILTGLLNLLFTHLIFSLIEYFFFVYLMQPYRCFLYFYYWLIGIFLLRFYKSIGNLRFILEPRWFKKTFKVSTKIPWARIVVSSLMEWINIMTKNPKRELSFYFYQNEISIDKEFQKSFHLDFRIFWNFL